MGDLAAVVAADLLGSRYPSGLSTKARDRCRRSSSKARLDSLTLATPRGRRLL
jgi:hypothetical protein